MEINLDFVRIVQNNSPKTKAREKEILAERNERALKYHRNCVVRNILDNIISFGAILSGAILITGMAYIMYILTGITI